MHSQAAGEAAGSSFTVSDTEFQGTSSNYIPGFRAPALRLSTAYLCQVGSREVLEVRAAAQGAGTIVSCKSDLSQRPAPGRGRPLPPEHQ